MHLMYTWYKSMHGLERELTNDGINRTPGYQVKIRHFVQLFILFFGAVFGFKMCKISL